MPEDCISLGETDPSSEWQKRLELAQKAGLRIGLWDWDVVADTVVWSDETYRQFGYTRQTFSGRVEDAVSRLHAEDRPRVEKAIREVLDGIAKEYSAQYRVVRPDGTTCWIDAHGILIRNGSSHMLGVGVDVTALKNATESLKESEEQYWLLLNSTAEAIYGLNLEGNCTFCNPACVRQLGHQSPEDLLGKNMHALIHHTRPDGTSYPEKECQIYSAVRGGARSHVTDEVLWRANGTSFSAEYWSYPIHKAGQLVGAVVTFLDISARVEAEQALRESEQKYRSLFENATFGIYRSDPAGSLLDVNPALVAMLGYASKQELLTRNLDRDIYEDASARRSILAGYDSSPRMDGIEVNWRRKDGQVIAVRTTGGVVRKQDGSVSHYEVIVEDITERRRLERQYRQAQKMEAIGQIAGGVAHDFNNVIGVILGNMELLSERLPSDELTEKYCERIRLAVRSATDVTRQLLAFSRKQILQPVIMDLNKSVEQLHKMMQRLIGEHIRVSLCLEPALGSVKADPGQIEQVLMNLVVNARDAMRTGGSLKIQTANVHLDQEFVDTHLGAKPGDYVKLSVADTGCGMTPEVVTHIYEPFFTTKEPGKGTGLGLATVYGIVKQSEGYIAVTSEVGMGTTFDIYLPSLHGEPIIKEEKKSPGFSWGTETILLVEDDQSLREVTVVRLEQLGYKVIEAENPERAIEQFEKHKDQIDLLLTDVVMPGMNGRSLVETLRAKKPGLCILYMSGYTDDEILRQGILNARHEILVKPFTKQRLGTQVRLVLGLQGSKSPANR
ncbi:MAG: PAS domain S-box protein [Candidatus Acidiferrum sp.]